MSSFYFIPIFIGCGPWVLNILALSTSGEIYFSAHSEDSLLRPHSPAVSKPSAGQCSSARFMWKCWPPRCHLPVQGRESSAPKPSGILVHARSRMQPARVRRNGGKVYGSRSIGGWGVGRVLDKNSAHMNSCPPLLNDLSAD